MDNNFNLENIEPIWNEFTTFLLKQTEMLRDNLEIRELKIRKLDTFKEIVDKSRDDINYLIDHKQFFYERNENIGKDIRAIEKFREINALDNSVVSVLVNKIFNSDYVINLDNEINSLIEEDIAAIDEIEGLEEIRNSTKFSDDLIKEYAETFSKSYETDQDLIVRLLRFYPILKSAKKNVIKTNKYEEKFNDVMERFNNLNEIFGDIIIKYKEELVKMKPIELNALNSYISLLDDNFDQVKSEYLSPLISCCTKEILDLMDIITDEKNSMNGKYSKAKVKSLKEYVDDYEIKCNKLLDLDKKIKVDNIIDVNSVDDSHIFFLSDIEGNILLSTDERKNIEAFTKLLEHKEVNNVIKTPLLIKDASDIIGRTPIAQRINDRAISLLNVKDNNNDDCLLVIAISSVSNKGCDTVKKETLKVCSKNYDNIIQNLSMINSGDLSYREYQQTFRKSLTGSKKEI